VKAYFHFYIRTYALNLQENLLKTNPCTLSIASAKEFIASRRRGCEARKFYSLGGATR